MKSYTLKNGFIVNLHEFYDGYHSQYRWCVWKPNGELYRSCNSYKEAYALASKIKRRKKSMTLEFYTVEEIVQDLVRRLRQKEETIDYNLPNGDVMRIELYKDNDGDYMINFLRLNSEGKEMKRISEFSYIYEDAMIDIIKDIMDL